jgi:hypothetical protein
MVNQLRSKVQQLQLRRSRQQRRIVGYLGDKVGALASSFRTDRSNFWRDSDKPEIMKEKCIQYLKNFEEEKRLAEERSKKTFAYKWSGETTDQADIIKEDCITYLENYAQTHTGADAAEADKVVTDFRLEQYWREAAAMHGVEYQGVPNFDATNKELSTMSTTVNFKRKPLGIALGSTNDQSSYLPTTPYLPTMYVGYDIRSPYMRSPRA